jgi:hypothetical protein
MKLHSLSCLIVRLNDPKGGYNKLINLTGTCTSYRAGEHSVSDREA